MIDVERLAWNGVLPTTVFLLSRPDASVPPNLLKEYNRIANRESCSYFTVQIDTSRPLPETINQIVQIILEKIEPDLHSQRRGISSPSTKGNAEGAPPWEDTDRRLRLPLVFSSLQPTKPSKVYDTFWRFAAERQAIFFRKLRGPTSSVTNDPILQHYKFTNAYRASDRVSQFLIRNVIYRGSQEPAEVFFRTILFKMFNKIETWNLIEEAFGEILYREYSFDRYDSILSSAMAAGDRIYSAAYIMPTAKAYGPDKRKHRTHLRLLEKMMGDDLCLRIIDARNMRQAFELLHAYPMLGDFLAYQFMIDLNYSHLVDFSEEEFIVAGPGARDGLRKCFESTGGLSEADLIRVVADRQQVEFNRLGLHFESLWGRPLQLIDCQNLFCEVSKYARLAHPEVPGLSGRTRIKQIYRANQQRILFWYPPKWGLNDAVATDQPDR
jgi:hypothetical protein